MKIILCTFNAKYIHTSLALKYLKANLGEFQNEAKILEFTINDDYIKSTDLILSENPDIIAFSVYLWNVEITTGTAELLKLISPEIKIILGGPEVSFEYDLPDAVDFADYVITGPGEKAFYDLCTKIYEKNFPKNKIIHGIQSGLENIVLPYELYTEEDIAHRLIYVETSRGCPHKCEFCISSLDKKVFKFPIDKIFNALNMLWSKGVRHFKFLDRALQLTYGADLLTFFLNKNDEVFLHFELVPHKIPDSLKTLIERFPAGSLQFEVGVQTFNPEVSKLISRPSNKKLILENLKYLSELDSVHVHSDLIAGLPGEDMQSFKESFNTLLSAAPDEIQLGILKLLRGTPIHRHITPFKMKFNPHPPYEILENNLISFREMLDIKRFARYWEIVSNSGNFKNTVNFLLEREDPFESFFDFSKWLYAETGQTHAISLNRLSEFIFIYLTQEKKYDVNLIKNSLISDYNRLNRKSRPLFMQNQNKKHKKSKKSKKQTGMKKRQDRHRA